MYILKAPNINGLNIAVTNIATLIFDLINTAAGTTANNAGYPVEANGIDILAEDGDVRITFDDSIPTSTKGFLIRKGNTLFLRGIPLKRLRLIRTGSSNVKCSIQVGRCAPGESSAISGGDLSNLVSYTNDPATASDPGAIIMGVVNESRSDLASSDLVKNPMGMLKNGTIFVEQQRTWVKTGTLQNAAAATGNGTVFDVSGFATAVFNVRGTFVGTISFEASTDDTNWEPLLTTQVGSNTIATTATGTGIFRASVGGLKTVRARISAYTSGSITVDGRATNAVAEPKVVLAQLYQLISGENQAASRMMMSRPATTARITTATTTTVLSGACAFGGVVVEVALTGTVTVYDNTAASGTIKMILPIGTPAGVYAPSMASACAIGCTVVTSAADRVVAYAEPN